MSALLQKEKEILIDLVDEEIEETQNLLDKEFEETKVVNETIESKLETLKDIKEALSIRPYSKEAELGIAIGRLSNSYSFNEIYKFITHKQDSCYACETLRNLYERFGYKEVNELIIQVGNEKEENKDE